MGKAFKLVMSFDLCGSTVVHNDGERSTDWGAKDR